MNPSSVKIKQQLPYSLAHLKIYQLGFLYTRKCNLACKHCAYECSPQETEKLKFEKVSECIDEAALLGIETIAFSGGEALLYFNEILELIQQVHGNGQKSVVVTNGTWARTRPIASSKMNQLKKAGLDNLAVSYDALHEEAGAQIEQIENVIFACREAGVPIVLKRASNSNWDSNWEANGIRIAKQLRRLNCKVNTSKVAIFGSARKNFPENRERCISEPTNNFSRCNTIGNFTYIANGDLLPCCGGCIYDLIKFRGCNHLKLGNIYENSLKEGLSNARNNLFIRILAQVGAVGFKTLSEEYPNKVKWPDKLMHPCDFCFFAARSNEFNQWFSLLEKNKYQILSKL